MDGDIFWITLLVCTIGYAIASTIIDDRKETKEMKRLENTPIEVHRYKYKIHLIDGSKYEKESDFYVTDDFEEFVSRILLEYATLEIKNGLVINIENIAKAELIRKETKIIRPEVNRYYKSFYLSKGYSVEEAEKREVK